MGWDTSNPNYPHIPPKSSFANTSPVSKLARISHPETEFRLPYLRHPSEAENPFPGRLTLEPMSLEYRGKTKVEKSEIANRRIASLVCDDTLVGFSDGSKVVRLGTRRVGIGFSITRNGTEIQSFKAGIGPRAEIYDAEMFGIALAMKESARIARDSPIRHIHLFSDNQAAVQSILNIDPHPAQYASIIFREAAFQFLNANPENSIEVRWIPGHANIRGNERADKLACEGTYSTPVSIFNRTVTWSKSHATQSVVRDWRRAWASKTHSDIVNTHMPNPPSLQLNRVFDKDNPPRHLTSRLTHLFTGHGFIGEYAARMPFLRDVESSCPCGEPEQTIAHVLYHCPLHIQERDILKKVSPDLNPAELFGTANGLLAIRSYVLNSNILCPK